MALLDRLGASTKRLTLAFVAALALTAIGSLRLIGGDFLASVLSFGGGAVFALALTSWQVNAVERSRADAMRLYWKPFSTDSVICLSMRLPQGNDNEEISPFTPYHDAIAGQQVQRFLHERFGKHVPLTSATDFADLRDIGARHLILIGGPNHNHLTDKAMNLLWERSEGRYLHWSSTLSAMSSTSSLVTESADHLLKVQSVDGRSHRVDSIGDLYDVDGRLITARGMCLRLEGLHRGGSHLLVLAGVSSAFGTLAAVEHTLDAAQVASHAMGDSQVIVGADLNGSLLDSPTPVRVIQDGT